LESKWLVGSLRAILRNNFHARYPLNCKEAMFC